MENAIRFGYFERAAIQRERSLSDARHGKGASGGPAGTSRTSNQPPQKKGRLIRVRGTLTISV